MIVVSLVALASVACESTDSASGDGGSRADASSQSLAQDADTIPCGPRAVLVAVCQQCHSQPPVNDAPFSLVTRSNIVRVGASGEIRRLMIEQLDARRMPLSPVTMDDADRSVLLDWLRAGAPAVYAQSCIDAGAADADAGTTDAPATATATDPDAGADLDAGAFDASDDAEAGP
jgi:uncharacterized membrane protein